MHINARAGIFSTLMLVGTSISYLHVAGPCASNHLPPVLIILNISVILHQDQLRAFSSFSMHYQLLLLVAHYQLLLLA